MMKSLEQYCHKKMKPSEQLVVAAYNANPDSWKTHWKQFCVLQFAIGARGYILSVQPMKISPQFRLLDDHKQRLPFIDEDQGIQLIESALVDSAEFKKSIIDAFNGKPFGRPSQLKIRQILTPLIKDSIRSPEASHILASIKAHDIYRSVSTTLAAETYDLANQNKIPNEADLLVRAILTYYFNRWQMSFSLLYGELVSLSKGTLGLRGSLVSIQNVFYASNNVDQFSIPFYSWPQGEFLHGLESQTELLGTINHEASEIPLNKGFFHKAFGVSQPVDSTLMRRNPRIKESVVRDGRTLSYKQYEYSSLIFMSVIGIEYLLRTYCAVVQTGEADIMEVLEKSSYLSPDLRTDLMKVLGHDGWNIRNRCLHGSFLEVDSRRLELTLGSQTASCLGVSRLDLSKDGSVLENVASCLLALLSRVADEIIKRKCVSTTLWADRFHLTEEELTFGRSVHCDLLQDQETGKTCISKIVNYLREVTPCLSIPLQNGVLSWFKSPVSESTLPGFSFLMLFFEPLLRLTLHMSGRDILQTGIAAVGDRKAFRVQYRTMDANNLVTAKNVEWLISCLDSKERPVAERTLMLAVKCRDAFAHGALINYSEETHNVYGHIVIKAIQLIVECGMFHINQSSKINSVRNLT